MSLDPVVALGAFGGTARWSQLQRSVRRRQLARAVREGHVLKLGAVYALVGTDEGLVAARRLRGVASHRSAARQHGFALPPGPDHHDVLLPPRSHRSTVPEDVRLHFGAVPEADRAEGVTNRVLTVVHCLRDLPLRDALSVGDSALRAGVPHEDIAAAVASLRGPGSARARQRFALLDARSENAFESSCRALLIDGGIRGFRPQVTVTHRREFVGRVDLGDAVLRIAIECDGFATHGSRQAMVADCVRHTRLTAAGWRSLRFTWEQVMFRGPWILAQVAATIDWAAATRTRKATQRPRQRPTRAA